jgi:hypothetical protein
MTADLDVRLRLDRLGAEAKRPPRRRRLLALAAIGAVAAAGAVWSTSALGPSGTSIAVRAGRLCAAVPSGWQGRTMTNPDFGVPAVILTNFRFGRIDDFYGLANHFKWPANGVMVVVSNGFVGNLASSGALRVTRADFGNDFGGVGEESAQPSGGIAVISKGRVLNVYVEVGKLTPATIAAANEALAGVRICSA